MRRSLARMASNAGPASSQTPAWASWRLNPPSAAPEAPTTYGGQSKLPRLPVPKLADTVAKLRKGVPAVSRGQDETQAFLRKLQEFEQSSLAAKLQERLEARAAESSVARP